MMFFLNLPKNANQQELDNLFKLINSNEFTSHAVSKAAFSKARKNLSHSAFIDLNHQLIDRFYSNSVIKKWQGFRLCAIDGSQFRLPNEPDIVQEFGWHKGKSSNKYCAMALSSMYYDVLNEMVIDSSLNPPHCSERELASQHLLHAEKNDLILFDRNYPVFWLYAQMESLGVHFCMRVRDSIDTIFKEFKESGKKESLITIRPNRNSINMCIKKGLPTAPLKVRLIRVELKNEVEILITNLTDKTQYPACLFKKLYHFRWGIEEGYKRQKIWLDIENFSGKSALSVKQDYYAKIVTLNLTAMMVNEGQRHADIKHEKRRLKYKINFAQALSKMKDNIVLFLLNADWKTRIDEFIKYIAATAEAVRNGRQFDRKKIHYNKRINHLCYKRCR